MQTKGRINMDNTLEEAKVILKKYNQEHLLNGYENLDEKKQKQLLKAMMVLLSV